MVHGTKIKAADQLHKDSYQSYCTAFWLRGCSGFTHSHTVETDSHSIKQPNKTHQRTKPTRRFKFTDFVFFVTTSKHPEASAFLNTSVTDISFKWLVECFVVLAGRWYSQPWCGWEWLSWTWSWNHGRENPWFQLLPSSPPKSCSLDKEKKRQNITFWWVNHCGKEKRILYSECPNILTTLVDKRWKRSGDVNTQNQEEKLFSEGCFSFWNVSGLRDFQDAQISLQVLRIIRIYREYCCCYFEVCKTGSNIQIIVWMYVRTSGSSPWQQAAGHIISSSLSILTNGTGAKLKTPRTRQINRCFFSHVEQLIRWHILCCWALLTVWKEPVWETDIAALWPHYYCTDSGAKPLGYFCNILIGREGDAFFIFIYVNRHTYIQFDTIMYVHEYSDTATTENAAKDEIMCYKQSSFHRTDVNTIDKHTHRQRNINEPYLDSTV